MEISDSSYGKIRLRRFARGEDLSQFLGWYRDPEVLLYSEGDREADFDLDRVERMYSYLQGIGTVYIIEVLDSGNWIPIGDATLSRSTIPIVIGDARFRSKGLGKIVLSMLVSEAKDLEWKELNVKCIYEYNERSLRLFHSLGFEVSGNYTDDAGRKCISMKKELRGTGNY